MYEMQIYNFMQMPGWNRVGIGTQSIQTIFDKAFAAAHAGSWVRVIERQTKEQVFPPKTLALR